MATMTLTLGTRVLERVTHRETLFYSTGVVADANWNILNGALPFNILEAQLQALTLEGFGGTIGHAVDYAVSGEMAMLRLARSGGGPQMFHKPSNQVRGFRNDAEAAGATPISWATDWDFRFFPFMQARDGIQIEAPPPADDAAGFSGTYRVRLTLLVNKYHKA